MPGNFAHKESTAQVRWMAANGQLRFGMKEAPLPPGYPVPPRAPPTPPPNGTTPTYLFQVSRVPRTNVGREGGGIEKISE